MSTEKDNAPKAAVRCQKCNKILAFKIGTASGFLHLKCPACKTLLQVDLVEGYTQGECAVKLHITQAGVFYRIQSIFGKFTKK